METISGIIPDAWIYALGWTVVHSLWQGALVATLLTLFRRLAASAAPQVRYVAGLIALLAMFVLSAWTFSFHLYSAVAGDEVVISLSGISAAGNPSFMVRITDLLNQNLPLLVAAWGLGMAFFALRTAGGFWYVNRLRQTGMAPESPIWQERLERIAANLGISRAVGLLESAHISVPLVIGHLKPVVLLPVGLVNQLSITEVEAILAHELAHIRRWDYLFNLLQSALEILYYFNPAVWYISTTVRNERENCCDDWAVEMCGSSMTYVRALVHIQERVTYTPQFALSMAGGKKPLLHRVKRILNQPNHKKTIMERFIATLLLLAAVAVFSVSATRPEVQDSYAGLLPEESSSDSIPPAVIKRQRIVKEEGDRRLELTTENGSVVELKVNGEVIPKEKMAAYQKDIDGLHQDMKRPEMAPPPPPPPPAPGAPAPPAPPRMEKEIRIIKTHPGDEEKVMIWIDEESGEKKEIRVEADEIHFEGDPGRIMIFKDEEMKEFRIQEESARAMEEAHRVMEKKMIRMERGDLKSAIESELRRDGYIRDSGSYQFELSGKKLVINGKKESDVIFEKYKRIYEQHTGLILSKDSRIEVEQ